MSHIFRHSVSAPVDTVWRWHERSGAVERLTPPFLPMAPRSQADNLRDGVTVFSLPAGLTWRAQHVSELFEAGRRFADEWDNTPFKGVSDWRHVHTFEEAAPGRTTITDEVETKVPRPLISAAFAYRQRQLEEDMRALARFEEISGESLRVAVTGSTGTVGTALCAQLSTAGHTVVALKRSASEVQGENERHWDPESPSPDLLEGIDVVIHLAGAPIFGRFDDDHKKKVYDSRVGPTRRLAELVARTEGVRALVCASAIGFYGADRGDTTLTETSERGEGFLADVTVDWEKACEPAREAGKRVVNVRTGLVLSGNSGLLPLLKTVVSTGLGGPVGGGKQWMPWIALDDLTDIYITAALDKGLSGAVNGTAPSPARNRDFMRTLGTVLRRPTIIPVPSLAPALLLGSEGAEEVALANQRVLPAVLSSRGHHFRFQELEDLLRHELGKHQAHSSDTASDL